jgi:unsaturated chondroitin disaccharide hydrolase
MTSDDPKVIPRTARRDLEFALETAQEQVRCLISDHPGQIPIFTVAGRWHFDEDAWAPAWTGGFLAGMIWIFAERTNDPWWHLQAEKYSQLLEPRKLDEGTHDLGFLFTPSWGRWHRLHPTARTRDVIIQAGRTMAKRFNCAGKYLRTWVDRGSTFIDVMMNVDIVFQAAELSGDPGLADIARQHALTTRRFLVRGDSSTAHEGWFDPDTGEFLRAATHQGFRADSTWVRGHAWAIYGFGSVYARTRDERFLDTARRCADFYIDQTGSRYVAANDWNDPAPEYPYEASAAGIAAAGMLQLASLMGAEGARYREYAAGILGRLCTPEFLGSREQGWEGVIKHAIYHRKNNLGVNESVMWGDHYFVEALHRMTQGVKHDLAVAPETEASSSASMIRIPTGGQPFSSGRG